MASPNSAPPSVSQRPAQQTSANNSNDCLLHSLLEIRSPSSRACWLAALDALALASLHDSIILPLNWISRNRLPVTWEALVHLSTESGLVPGQLNPAPPLRQWHHVAGRCYRGSKLLARSMHGGTNIGPSACAPRGPDCSNWSLGPSVIRDAPSSKHGAIGRLGKRRRQGAAADQDDALTASFVD